MANDTDQRPGICYSEYVGNGSRLGYVPLIEPPGNGASQAQVTGFLRVFLWGPVTGTGTIPVEFISEPTPVRSETWGRTKTRYH
jgi:hypothetical protein